MPVMDLDAYRQKHGLSWSQLAGLIGVKQAKQARAYGLGHQWPRPERLEAILRATKGAVTIDDMHRRRLRVSQRDCGSSAAE